MMLDIKVGEKWKNRAGVVLTIMSVTGLTNDAKVIAQSEQGRISSYNKNGMYHSKLGPSSFDLVSKYVKPREFKLEVVTWLDDRGEIGHAVTKYFDWKPTGGTVLARKRVTVIEGQGMLSADANSSEGD